MTATTTAIRAKFQATRTEINAALIEREDEIDLLLAAMIAGEHALLVSQPGTAKSLLVDTLMGWVDSPSFSILLTKFTEPAEVVGPIDLPSLKAGGYKRITRNRLPEACTFFGDEIFKASSAILNTLLRLLNERVYENDGAWCPAPLRFAVGASNEWPNSDTGKELGALFDRFVFRKTVAPIRTAAGEDALLDFDHARGDHKPRLSTTITPEEIDAAVSDAAALPWTDDAKTAFREISRQLKEAGVLPGDRRRKKSVRAAQAYAWLAGATEVKPEHLEILAHVLWEDPAEQPAVVAKIVARVANPVGMQVSARLMEIEEIMAATDLSSLAQTATATAKLTEIGRQLKTIGPDPRAVKATEYVRGLIRKIRYATLDRSETI